MAVITAGLTPGNYDVGATWVGGSAPGNGDDAVIPATAVVTIAAATTVAARSVTVAASGTLAWAATTSIINIGDATAGAGNVAFSNAGTLTLTGIGTINFISTSATVQTITTGGQTMPNMTVNAASNGSFQLADATTLSSATTMTLTKGTFDANSKTCSFGVFSSNNANVRTLTLGSSSITLTGTATVWNTSTATNLTVTSNTATVTCAGTGRTFNLGAVNYNGTGFSFTGATTAILTHTGATVGSFTRSGTAVKTDGLTISPNVTLTVTGLLTLSGQSLTNRLLVSSATIASVATISAGSVSLSNVDFMDITAAGVASPFTGTSLGDALGNTNITTDTPTNQTHTTSLGGNLSDATKWTSRVPLPQDNVIVDGNTSGTLTIDMPRIGKNLTFTGFAGTLAGSGSQTMYGSLILSSAMTMSTTPSHFFAGRSSQTLNFAGVASLWTFAFTAPGTYQLLSDWTITGSTQTGGFVSGLVSGATFDANGFNVTMRAFISSSGSTIKLGSGTWTLTGSVTVWSCAATVVASTSTMIFNDTSSGIKNFAGGGQTYNILTYTVGTNAAPLVITGANTIDTINIGTGRVVTYPASTVNTVNHWNVNGVNNGYMYLPGVVGSYMSTPNAAALQITGDIDVQVRVARDNWAAGTSSMIVSKLHNSGQFAYDFWFTATNNLEARISLNGSDSPAGVSTVAITTVSPANGSPFWIRFTRVAATGVFTFYYAADQSSPPSSWTQLGGTASATSGNIFAGNGIVEIGSNVGGTTNLLAGKVYRALILNGIAGTVVFDADLTTKPFGANTFTESSANAATVTINGAQAQSGDGRVLVNSSLAGTAATLLFGNRAISDYITVQDNTATITTPAYAGSHGALISGTTNWLATDAPIISGGTMTLLGVG